MTKQPECPIEYVSVNENVVRLTAFFVFVIASLYLYFNHWSLSGLLLVDFFQRSFNKGRYSPLAWTSRMIARSFHLPYKPVDRGAKIFAAQLGFVFADMLFIFSMVNLHSVASYFAGLIILFAFLESFFGFCAGCYLYSFYKKVAAK